MKTYDFDDSDTIKREDLVRVFKRLGLSTIEPHLPTIFKVGGVGMKDERIDIVIFSAKLMDTIDNIMRRKKSKQVELINKLHSLLKAKGLSIYDMFVRLDVNKDGSLSKIETSTGI